MLKAIAVSLYGLFSTKLSGEKWAKAALELNANKTMVNKKHSRITISTEMTYEAISTSYCKCLNSHRQIIIFGTDINKNVVMTVLSGQKTI